MAEWLVLDALGGLLGSAFGKMLIVLFPYRVEKAFEGQWAGGILDDNFDVQHP